MDDAAQAYAAADFSGSDVAFTQHMLALLAEKVQGDLGEAARLPQPARRPWPVLVALQGRGLG
ncbi:MAG: hypothetical protein VKI42_10895 [Synechococcaceae cyanobacterium]|nr:hypothetical protein [Synechococcaceae cyanobacterium]